jgi:putative FmdB family regulatory protein
MPLYDYKCTEHGYFEAKRAMKDHASAECPDCGTPCKQVITVAPGLDIEAMADIGMPGAFEKSGDRLTERHRKAGQAHTEPPEKRETVHGTR